MAFRQIDGNLARIGAFFVISFVVAYLLTSAILLLYILAIDFFTRIYWYKPYSIIFQLSTVIKKILKIETKMTDAGAKRLAALFGLMFSIMLIVQAHFNFDTVLYATASILLICASLELLFDYCIGCKVYYIIKKIYPNF